jgi:N-acetylneuraminate synthase
MKPISIGTYSIGLEHPPFIIAELSGNHNQSLEKALSLVDAAAAAGVHAMKLQTYTADSITIDSKNSDFLIKDPNSLWKGKNLYSLYQVASTPYEWHKSIFDRCRERGILCFSTPFDEAAVDFLEQFNPPCYKIASFENNHYPLIRKVIKTNKPIIISLGLTSIDEILELNEFLTKENAENIIFLKCTSAYPALPKDANLRTIPFLREKFKRHIGLSDHTLGIEVSLASVALGACVIEKHFTDSRASGGVDAAFSLEPHEVKTLVDGTRTVWESLGKPIFDLSDSEKKSLQFKRSIYVVKDINEGDAFSVENIRVIRPSFGIPPKYFEEILGKKSKVNLKRGTALTWDEIEK